MKIGNIFSRNFAFRPSFEFAYGEVTNMFALNAEILYNVPFGALNKRWFYLGLGPGFNFVEKSFAGGAGTSRVNFSDFNYVTSLNLLAGIQYRSGWFAELKTSVYGAPTVPVIRLLVGYTF